METKPNKAFVSIRQGVNEAISRRQDQRQLLIVVAPQAVVRALRA